MAFGSSGIPWNFVWWMRRYVTTAPASLNLLLLGSVSLRFFFLFIQTETKIKISWISCHPTWIILNLLPPHLVLACHDWFHFAEAQGLERVASICKARNLQMPSGLIVMGDNTVRELKNQYNLKYLANLCAAARWESVVYFFCASRTRMTSWIKSLVCLHEEFQGQIKSWATVTQSPLLLMNFLGLVSGHGWAQCVSFSWKN